MNKPILLSLIVGLLIANFLTVQAIQITVPQDKLPFLDLNILCTQDYNSILFKGYDVCVYIPNLNQALTCHY